MMCYHFMFTLRLASTHDNDEDNDDNISTISNTDKDINNDWLLLEHKGRAMSQCQDISTVYFMELYVIDDLGETSMPWQQIYNVRRRRSCTDDEDDDKKKCCVQKSGPGLYRFIWVVCDASDEDDD